MNFVFGGIRSSWTLLWTRLNAVYPSNLKKRIESKICRVQVFMYLGGSCASDDQKSSFG